MSLELGLGPWTAAADGAAPVEEFLRQVELAERLGYGSVWLPESHFEPEGACPSPLLVLAAAAARTTSLRLGTTSYLLPFRHPLQIAEDVAVLDRISGGRVLLGVGRGFRSTLFTAFGVAPSEKRDRFETTLRILRKAWRGEAVLPGDPGSTRDGAVRVHPSPVQKPHPPIWVAAFGPKALAQAGRLGLPYLASPVEPIVQLEENYAQHRAALPDDCERPLPVPVIRTVYVDRDRRRAEEIRTALGEQAGRVARRLGDRFARLAETPVGDWALVGPPSEIRDGVARYRERVGLTHLIARVQVPTASGGEIEASIRLLAETLL